MTAKLAVKGRRSCQVIIMDMNILSAVFICKLGGLTIYIIYNSTLHWPCWQLNPQLPHFSNPPPFPPSIREGVSVLAIEFMNELPLKRQTLIDQATSFASCSCFSFS